MRTFRELLQEHPRIVAALCFGVSTGLLTHFAWYPTARFNGLMPELSLTAGVVHAVSGAFTGPRLIDASRTRTPSQAARVGAYTSLLALTLFAPLMAAFVSAGSAPPHDFFGYVVLTSLTAVFAFLAAGWALLLLCVVIALGLHRCAVLSGNAGPSEARP